MHEFAIAEALATRVLAHAPAGARVREVEIQIGAMRGLEPDALKMCWEAVTFGTPMAGAVLSVDQLPWTVRCSNCGREWTSAVPFVSCACGNETPAPLGGDELDLVAITVEQDETYDERTHPHRPRPDRRARPGGQRRDRGRNPNRSGAPRHLRDRPDRRAWKRQDRAPRSHAPGPGREAPARRPGRRSRHAAGRRSAGALVRPCGPDFHRARAATSKPGRSATP